MSSWLDSVNDRNAIEKFPVAFKRYSFEAKYRQSVIWSLQCLRWNWDRIESGQMPYPWEVSIFAMLAMMGEVETAMGLPIGQANRMMNFIRSNMFCYFNKDIRCWAPFALAMPEVKHQFNAKILFERYHYFFSFANDVIDMPVELKRRLNGDWRALFDLFIVVYGMGLAGTPFEVFGKKVLQSDNTYFSASVIDLLKSLALPLNVFREKQAQCFALSPNGYFLSRNLLEEYPFVLKDNLYFLPAPHLCPLALTHRILDRMTQGDTAICSVIGKQIQEQYILKLFRDAACYERVDGSIQYGSHGGADSPDVIVRNGNSCLLIESKFTRAGYRIFDLLNETSNEKAKRYAEYIVQLYKQMCNRKKYLKDRDYQDENVFGLVVVFEDNLVFRDFVWENVGQKLSDNISYVRSHIHVVGLSEIEKYCYHKMDIVPDLRRWATSRSASNDFVIGHDGDWPDAEFPQFEHWLNDTNGMINRMLVHIAPKSVGESAQFVDAESDTRSA